MQTYKITRTRLVTEVFRVDAETEEDAFDTLGNGDEDGDYENWKKAHIIAKARLS